MTDIVEWLRKPGDEVFSTRDEAMLAYEPEGRDFAEAVETYILEYLNMPKLSETFPSDIPRNNDDEESETFPIGPELTLEEAYESTKPKHDI